MPLNTFTYFVEGHLNSGPLMLRTMILSRFPTFVQNLRRSPSVEVALMDELTARSTTACNLAYVDSLTGLNCATADRRQVKSLLPVKCVPEKESWRLGLLDALLHERGVLEKDGSQALTRFSISRKSKWGIQSPIIAGYWQRLSPFGWRRLFFCSVHNPAPSTSNTTQSSTPHHL